MGGLMTAMVAGLTSAALAVMGKLFTQKFFEAVISRVTIYSMGKLAEMTTNHMDDDLVQEAAKRLGLEYSGGTGEP